MRGLFIYGGIVAAVLLTALGVGGAIVYTNAPEDPLKKVDAIFVLGGEHDGREEYGLQLLREGIAPVLVISNPYPSTDTTMPGVCRTRVPNAEVMCVKPTELTTRGEAVEARRLADERGWKSLVVISWRFHLPRARMIFDRCFSSADGAVTMRAVPRTYDYSLTRWEFTYLYQAASTVRNSLRAGCQ
jgi:uncharacterized SAM-binding protein YcdF (DUF218 family)